MAVLQTHLVPLSVSEFAGSGAAPDQSRSASGVYTGLVCWHECDNQKAPYAAEENAAAERKQNMRYRRYSASSLTDSLRSVVRLRRAVPAYGRGGNFQEDTRKKLNRKR